MYAGKQLDDGLTLVECGVSRDSTVHLVLRLLGGKGGFGALLRSGARASHTQNFDACRDLSGRRLRHVTADEKLAGEPLIWPYSSFLCAADSGVFSALPWLNDKLMLR